MIGTMRAGWMIAIGALIVGCGGDDGPSGAPLTPSEAETGCAEYCDYRVECGEDEVECLTWCGGVTDVIRGDAARVLLDCYLEQACDATGEQLCIADTIESLEGTAAYDDAHSACYALESRCDVSYGCGVTYYVLLSDPTLDALAACFELPCDEVDACVNEVIGQL